MVHKRIVQPILETLEGERAEYFQRLMQCLEEDPRVDALPNLIYLSLKETIPYLPTYLEVPDLADALVVFVTKNRRRLNKVIFDRSFVENRGDAERLRGVTNEFITQTMAAVLEKYDDGKVAEEDRKTYRFSGDFDEADFPYKDLDE